MENTFNLTIAVYLTDELKECLPIASDVSGNGFEYHMRIVLNKFCFDNKLINCPAKSDDSDEERFDCQNESETENYEDSDSEIEWEDETEKKFKNDKANQDFFGTIYEIQKRDQIIRGQNDIKRIIIEQSCLNVNLRPFQMQSVAWMLERENFFKIRVITKDDLNMNQYHNSIDQDNDANLHPLY